MKKPLVSIIVPTYNRSFRLRKTLESLNELDFEKKDYEIIIIDDGSTDDTQEVLKSLKKKIKNMEYYLQENSKLSATRNKAIRLSKGEIIVSIDDDMLFEKDWLQKLIEPLKDELTAVSGGLAIAPPDLPLFERCVDYVHTCFSGTAGIRGHTKIKLAKYYPRGGNMAIKKKIFDEVGMFDVDFIPGEDMDLDYRIEKKGYNFAFVPDAFVWHYPRPNLKSFLKQLFGRGHARFNLIKRYNHSFEFIYLLPSLTVIGFPLLFLTSFFSKIAASLFIALGSLYVLLLFTTGINSLRKLKSLRAVFLIPFLLFLQHFSFGSGFLKSLFESCLKKE